MNNFQFVSEIARGPWAIEDSTLQYLKPMVASFLMGNTSVIPNPGASEEDEDPCYSEEANHEEESIGTIGVIKLSGVIAKQVPCGGYGTDQMVSDLDKFYNDSNCTGVIIHEETPGGSVLATLDAVQAIGKRNKPVVMVIRGQATSAGMWIAAACDKVYVEHKKSILGSIGVMTSIVDDQPYYEKLGIKFHTFNSNHSPDKNKDAEEIKKGKYDAYKRDVLDPLGVDFKSAINGRWGTSDEYLTGKTYFAEDVENVLFDEFGGMDDAVNYIVNNNPKVKMKKRTKLAAVLGAELKMQDGQVSLNDDQLDAIETALGAEASSGGNKPEAEESKEPTTPTTTPVTPKGNSGLDAVNARLDKLEAENKELKEENEKLSSQVDEEEVEDAGAGANSSDADLELAMQFAD